MTIHGAGFSARSGAGNNDKTTVAEKGILLATCHLSPLSCMAISSAWGSRRSSEDWQQSAKSGRRAPTRLSRWVLLPHENVRARQPQQLPHQQWV